MLLKVLKCCHCFSFSSLLLRKLSKHQPTLGIHGRHSINTYWWTGWTMLCWTENTQKQRSSCERGGSWTSFLSSGNHMVTRGQKSPTQLTHNDTPRERPLTLPLTLSKCWTLTNLKSVNTQTGKVQSRRIFFQRWVVEGGWSGGVRWES